MSRSPQDLPTGAASRLAYLDQLKLLLVALVVVHHAGQPYGPPEDWPLRSAAAGLPLGAFFEINGAFFMGLFFLISGLFLPLAVDRLGAFKAVCARVFRLGTPLVFLSVLVFGPISYATGPRRDAFVTYMLRDYVGAGAFQVGHLWFLSWLLVMVAAYGACRMVWRRPAAATPKPPGHLALLAAAAALAATSAIVRIWYPVGLWADLAPLVRVEAGRLPQYLLLFAGGLAAGRSGWLQTFPTGRGLVWLVLGLAAACLRLVQPWLVPMPSWAWLAEEAVIGIGLSVGLLVLSRALLDQPSTMLSELARDAFGVYLIHVFLVVGLQFALEATSVGGWARFGAVSVLGLVLSFAIVRGLRRVPLVSEFL
ncbi:acyltransferase family protein [Phenylobacterium sp.]|uniref:acyltransferase family protein n=1 Tax=Phenylobacterium sp. TaxID=1871053 RepID=UPI0025CC82F5|nr:acyltransferase family protein [Phenylobacterium sp.]